MTVNTSFWRRISHMFRPELPANGHDGPVAILGGRAADGGDSARDGSRNISAAGPGASERMRSPSLLMRWSGRSSSVAKRESAERVALLIDAMTQHFDKQDHRTAQVAEAVNRMATTLEQLPDLQRANGECIGSIAAHLSTANRHAVELRDTLARVPSSMQAQAEAIRLVSKQLEAAQQADLQLVSALQLLTEVVDSLGQSNTAQVTALQEIRGDNQDQREALIALVRQQNYRYLMAMIVVGVIVIGALAGLGAAMWALMPH